jgi:hypothetical protein
MLGQGICSVRGRLDSTSRASMFPISAMLIEERSLQEICHDSTKYDCAYEPRVVAIQGYSTLRPPCLLVTE